MTKMRNLALIGAGAVIALGVGSMGANAAILQYFGEDLNNSTTVPLASTPNADGAQASFLSGLVGVGTEDFESFATGTSAPLNLVFPGAGTATLNGSGSILTTSPGSTNGNGRYATSGSNSWEVSSGTFTINLSAPTAAFGFYGIDVGEFGDQLTVTLNDVAGTSIDIPHTLSTGDGSVFFFGLIGTTAADTFTSISFAGVSSEVFAFDDMTIGALEQVTVPEPASLGLLGLGLVGLGFAARRRTR